MMAPMNLPGRGTRRLALVLVALAMAAALRLLPFPAVFPEDGAPVRFVSPDCEYHMLRVERILAGGRVRLFDPDLNFPDGGVSIWPPLFDQAAALFVRGTRALFPGSTPAGAAAFFPLLPGLLFPLAVGAACRSVLPLRWSFAAALWSAGAPAFLLYSQLGHLDQHVVEGLLAATAIALAAHAAGRGGAQLPANRPPEPVLDDPAELRRRRELTLLALSGLAAGLLVASWQGGVYLLPVLIAALVVARTLERRRPTPEEMAALAAPATATATLATFLALRGEPPQPFTFVSTGWFQPAFLALCWSFAALFALRLRPRRLGSYAASGAGLAAGALAVALAGERLAGRLGDALRHFAQSSPDGLIENGGWVRYPAAWLRTIAEDRPLWPLSELLSEGTRLLTVVGLVALPAGLVLLAIEAIRRRRPAAAFLLVAGGAHLLLGISQRRYAFHLALWSALGLALLARRIAGSLGRRPLRIAPLLATASILLAIPFWRALPATIQQPGGDSARFVASIRTVVAPPPRDPSGRAEWGLLAPWSFGHTLLRWTGLPVAADNFGYGFEDQARFWLARSDAEGEEILRRRRVRYVLVTKLDSLLSRYASLLGLPPPADDCLGQRLRLGPLPPGYRLVLESRSGDLSPAGAFLPRYRLLEWRDPSPPSPSRPPGV
jgi:dolichyl-diphosphooligosaccharide--protein glycosyltransferase